MNKELDNIFSLFVNYFNSLINKENKDEHLSILLESIIKIIPYIENVALNLDNIISRFYSHIKNKFRPIIVEFYIITFVDLFINVKILEDLVSIKPEIVTSICNIKIQFLNYYLINIPQLSLQIQSIIEKYRKFFNQPYPVGEYKIINFRKEE